MNPNLLSQDDLREYTGIVHKSLLVDWLKKNRIAYYLNAKGEIVTTLAALNKPLIGSETDNRVVPEFT